MSSSGLLRRVTSLFTQPIGGPSDQRIPTFRYESLGSERKIRLLKIKPIRNRRMTLELQPPLECDIITVPLDSAPSYLALSYVWGDSTLCRPILCNGALMLITENLHLALWTVSCSIGTKYCEMWKKGKPIFLWADGICICQTDINEKNYQVAMMGDVYRKASGVIGYAGAPTEGDPRDAMLSLVAESDFNNGYLMFPDEKKGSDLCILDWKRNSLTDQVAREFWISPWLRRGWVTQEVALAAMLHVIYGTGPKHALWSLNDMDRIDTAVGTMLRQPGLLQFFRTDSDVSHVSSSTYSTRSTIRRQMLEDPDFQWPLITLLAINRFTETTNPKDRIYALLGFASKNAQESIRVDYSDDYSFTELLLDVSKYCVQRDAVEQLLAFADKDTNSNLPSWLPSWGPGMRDFQEVYSDYSCSSEPLKACLKHDGWKLCISGYIVDQAFRYGPGYPNPEGAYFLGWYPSVAEKTDISRFGCYIFLERAATLLQQGLSRPRKASYRDNEDGTEVVRRTLTLDRKTLPSSSVGQVRNISLNQSAIVAEQDIARAQDKLYYSAYLAVINAPAYGEEAILQSIGASAFGDDPVNSLREHVWRSYSLAKYRWETHGIGNEDLEGLDDWKYILQLELGFLKGMKLAATQNGRLGMVPEAMELSDIIVIFNGFHIPFVLRPVADNQYKVVDMCYLHGVMRGEMEAYLPAERAAGRMLEQEFVLI
ncbi:hypothetical protein VTL71DRAFT_3793 [Oculimacula yallundae]|uniref:Heterokaryon incompatibility domain-containing protein n=1 Tax=Oculimacula yallundae TaxID=86028 RepID=A0ABR4C420_9HELO